ncbi:hypothetical protein [Burkholderia ubonensis]|uniref:hypothetical protein n=1 Tax=Burkholderia ubonensis TaxID=101571 RepID=UPI0012FA20A4|nr:hypothetical protein [Burkholderia ubonensis]
MDIVESGSEAQRNNNFLEAREFTTPGGYFSAGLLSAGYDPHEQISVTFIEARGQGAINAEEVSRSERTYAAWEIAAGVHRHDKPNNDGHVLNYTFESVGSEDKQKIDQL